MIISFSLCFRISIYFTLHSDTQVFVYLTEKICYFMLSLDFSHTLFLYDEQKTLCIANSEQGLCPNIVYLLVEFWCRIRRCLMKFRFIKETVNMRFDVFFLI